MGSCIALALAHQAAFAQEPDDIPEIPTFAELESAGAVIGEIRINNQDIFDLDDPRENNFLYRLANTIHIRTRPSVIARVLLFKSGDPVSVRLIEESERLLLANSFIADVKIRPIAYHDGVADIEVLTRDSWSLEPGVSFSRRGGTNTKSATFEERNIFGTGVLVAFKRKSDVDRTTDQFTLSHGQAFGGRTQLNFSAATFDDGKNWATSIIRPFYALDTRWAAGVSASQSESLGSVVSGGTTVGRFRRKQETAETFGGWSAGLVNGWTHRYSIGLGYQDNAYSRDPAVPAPPELPADETLVSPFFRYEVVEDGFTKLKNRDQIERPEWFELGFTSTIQIGRAMTGLGSTRNLWQYSASVSDGFEPVPGHNLLAASSFSGRYGDGEGDREVFSASARYYLPHAKRALLFASLTGERAWNPDPGSELLLGGDNGLRGYPLRYQTGDRRVLFTLEERVYSDWYPFRLFRVGGAVFYDLGRAWGGDFSNNADPDWLANVGFGLRFFSVRSAFGQVFHFDVAFPLNRDPNIDSFQFIVEGKKSF